MELNGSDNQGFLRSETIVILQKSQIFCMNELEDESYIFEKPYASTKFFQKEVSPGFASLWVKNVYFQKWSESERMQQVCFANVITHSLKCFKSQTIYFWKALYVYFICYEQSFVSFGRLMGQKLLASERRENKKCCLLFQVCMRRMGMPCGAFQAYFEIRSYFKANMRRIHCQCAA